MKRTTPKPRISILHPEFRYMNSASTDIRKTFARIRKQMAAKPAPASVVSMKRAAK